MKNEIENGIVAFIAAALRQRDGLDPGDDLPIPVYAASGDVSIDETQPYIVAQVSEIPHVIGGIAVVDALVLVGSPHATGYETAHATQHRFLRTIFAPPVPPNLAANAAHLPEYLEAASDDEISSKGFAVVGYPGSDTGTLKQDGVALKIGVARNDATPLTASGDITVA
jgi:hypothetical protein